MTIEYLGEFVVACCGGRECLCVVSCGCHDRVCVVCGWHNRMLLLGGIFRSEPVLLARWPRGTARKTPNRQGLTPEQGAQHQTTASNTPRREDLVAGCAPYYNKQLTIHTISYTSILIMSSLSSRKVPPLSSSAARKRLLKEEDEDGVDDRPAAAPKKVKTKGDKATAAATKTHATTTVPTQDDVWDIVWPCRGGTIGNPTEVTLLLQIDPDDADHIDLVGAAGAIGRLEVDQEGGK